MGLRDAGCIEDCEEAGFVTYLVEDGGKHAFSDQIPRGRVESLCKVRDQFVPRDPRVGTAVYHKKHPILRVERRKMWQTSAVCRDNIGSSPDLEFLDWRLEASTPQQVSRLRTSTVVQCDQFRDAGGALPAFDFDHQVI